MLGFGTRQLRVVRRIEADARRIGSTSRGRDGDRVRGSAA
jgi:hypothetical protein